MAGGISKFVSGQIQDHILRDVSFTAPTSFWVALVKTPGESDLRSNILSSTDEVGSGKGYTRVEVKGTTGIGWFAAVNGLSEQNLAIQFPVATADWGTIYQAVLMDAAVGGNVWIFGPLTVPIEVLNGDMIVIPARAFDITI